MTKKVSTAAQAARQLCLTVIFLPGEAALSLPRHGLMHIILIVHLMQSVMLPRRLRRSGYFFVIIKPGAEILTYINQIGRAHV